MRRLLPVLGQRRGAPSMHTRSTGSRMIPRSGYSHILFHVKNERCGVAKRPRLLSFKGFSSLASLADNVDNTHDEEFEAPSEQDNLNSMHSSVVVKMDQPKRLSSSKVRRPAKGKKMRRRRKNPYDELKARNIPKSVVTKLQERSFLKRLRRFGSMSCDGYEHYWRCLLWAAEWHETETLKNYDIAQATLQRDIPEGLSELSFGSLDTASTSTCFLKVTGLEEGRPSVMLGDCVMITWNEETYRGNVKEVYLEHIRISLPKLPGFNSSIDRVHVRFLPSSRIIYMLGHHGTSTAKDKLPLAMLAPIRKNAQTALRTMRKRLAELDKRAKGQLSSTLQQAMQDQDTGSSINEESHNDSDWFNSNLNQEQRQAVGQILYSACQPLPYMILGPPGTGKSATITETVLQWLRHNPSKSDRILVVAPSNDATDLLLEKLNNSTSALTPSELIRVRSYRRRNTHPLATQLEQFMYDATNDAEEVCRKLLASRVVITTLNMATRFYFFGLPRGSFRIMVMDEAGHATEPETIAAASTLLDFENGGQLVLAGDPKQLGPVVMYEDCKRLGLDRSFMERLAGYSIYKRNKNDQRYEKGLVTMLTRNYRSHEAIIRLPNQLYYDGALTCHANVKTSHNMCDWGGLPKRDFPVFFHSVVGGEDQRDDSSPSWFNPREAEQCTEYARLLVKTDNQNAGLTCDEVGIITPYMAQARKIRLILKEMGLSDIKVGSVETFQGQERRAIILSTVRSLKGGLLKENIGFVANSKRFNVAVTRAQALLIVVGCAELLATDTKNWLPFLEYCHDNGAWKGGDWSRSTPKTAT